MVVADTDLSFIFLSAPRQSALAMTPSLRFVTLGMVASVETSCVRGSETLSFLKKWTGPEFVPTRNSRVRAF